MSTIYRTPKGLQTLTVTNASASALTVPAGANMAIISVEGNSIRFRDDGTAPTTSIGVIVNPGSTLELHDVVLLKAIQLIAVDNSASAVINASFYQQQ